jgi:hypothetical protein
MTLALIDLFRNRMPNNKFASKIVVFAVAFACASTVFAEGQIPSVDMNGVAFPAALCNDHPFPSEITGSLQFQVLQHQIMMDPNLPRWAVSGLSIEHACTLSDIVWLNLQWWVAYSIPNVAGDAKTNHRENLVLIYSPDFRRWAGMVEIFDYSKQHGWSLTRRKWLNDAPPGYQAVLLTQSEETVSADLFPVP